MKSISLNKLGKKYRSKMKIFPWKNLPLYKVIEQLLHKFQVINKDDMKIRNEEFKKFLGIWNQDDFNEFEKKCSSLKSVNSIDWK